MITGIYKILNIINGKFYIGSAINMKARWNKHRSDLRNNKHHSPYFQNAYNLYGTKNFIFKIIEEIEEIEEIEKEKLIEREQFYLDNLKPEYNICQYAYSSLGQKRSLETKEKIREAVSGERNGQYGKPAWNKGLSWNDEAKEKMRKAKIGKKQLKENIEKRRVSMLGKNAAENSTSNLNWNIVKEIRNERALGISKKEISLKYNISLKTVYNIEHFKTWKN